MIFVYFLGQQVSAQVPEWRNDNFRQDTIVVLSDSVQLNSRVILPEKLKVTDETGQSISELFYAVDYTSGKIFFEPQLRGKTLVIFYFIHPQLQIESLFSKDTAIIHEPIPENRLYAYEKDLIPEKKPFEGLNSRGSLVRGIRFGNNQSASVQSSLDLQLTGQLSKDIGINAVISDNNAPIQADGYTQKLQEFDKIYVELFNKNSKVRAGHIDLVQQNDFFGNFEQKVTGVQIGTELTHGDISKTRIFAAGSTTRGEYAKTRITGQNGNQGPYRLKGNNGELYIIIVSGSERIYIDGIELTRGEDRDYVINYNTGELTFTSQRLITDNTRITAEYLYANRTYSQFLLYGGVEHESEKFNIAGHFFSQSDAKNSPLTDNLSDEDKEILAEAGNNTDLMFNTTAVPTTYDPDKNLYRKITIGDIEIFEYSNDPNEQLYEVTFTFMGANKGNYLQSNVEINGKIFEYIPPVNGVPQGNYEPVRNLIPPKSLQVYTMNAAYKFQKGGLLGLDLGLSNKDENLFSSKDDGKNLGFAARLYGNHVLRSDSWMFKPGFEFSFIMKNFQAFQKLRNIEFYRDFNLENELSGANQTYLQAGLEVAYKDSLNLGYRLHYLKNEGQYQGFKNDLNLTYQSGKNLAEARISFLKADKENLITPELPADGSDFLRYNLLYKRRIGKTFWVGTQYMGESNRIEDHLSAAEGNHLSALSFRWDEIRGMAGIGDTARLYAELAVYNRRDDSVRLGSMQRLTNSNGLVLSTKLINKQDHHLDFAVHYRSVKYTFEELPSEDYITGNVRWQKGFFRNGMKLNVFYELGSGVEPQREFEYVKVTDGTGIYKWTDYNGDGLEQLDEFEMAEYQDQANYIRVFTNTINYEKTNKNKLNLSVRIRPRELLNSENEFLGRWMLQASLLSDNSLLKNGKSLEWNPFVRSDELLGKNQSIRAGLDFNRGSKYKWNTGYVFSKQEALTYIFTGMESRSTRSHQFSAGYRPWTNFYFYSEAENIRTIGNSSTFVSKRFTVDTWRIQPKLSYQTEKSFVASVKYTFQNKVNKAGLEKLLQSDLGVELQWNDGNKSSLLGNFNFVKNNFTGNGQSVVGNMMMEGLKSGDNYVWQVLFQRQLNSYLNINFSYDGRKSENDKAIHSGSIQLQARF